MLNVLHVMKNRVEVRALPAHSYDICNEADWKLDCSGREKAKTVLHSTRFKGTHALSNSS